jgi:hypothetical protein
VNVLLLHFDGKMQSLPLMKLAAMHHAAGDRVVLRHAGNLRAIEPELSDPSWDRVYGSLIFEASKPLARRAQVLYPGIILGGTGWDFEDGTMVRRSRLPDEAETIAPDYDIYPWSSDLRRGRAASIGYTQRGCRLKCGFCVVPQKEGKMQPIGSLHDLWRGAPWPRQAKLLDNDFFGNPAWPDIVAEAERDGWLVSLIQGINARFLNEETARAAVRMKLKDDQFERPRIYTAWDGLRDEKRLMSGLRCLVDAGAKPDHLMVYMLIGHADGETHEERDYRRIKLREFGARPYPMPYVRRGESPSGTGGDELVAFAKWCYTRADLHVPWEKWWGKARGNPRKLGDRRVTLPLFVE